MQQADSEGILFETKHRRKDGSVFPVEVSSRGTIIDGDRVLFSIIRDITERKQTEYALRESEEKYRNLVERANDGIIIIQDGKIKYANQRLIEMSGETLEDIIDHPFIDFIYPDELPKVADRYTRRLRGEEVPHIYETVLIRKDGSKIYAELNAGTVTYYGKTADFVIIRDITGRKLAEDALREGERKYRSVLETMQDIFYRTDRQGNIVLVSPSAAKLVEVDSYESLIGKNILDFYANPADRKKLLEELKRKGSVGDYEVAIKKIDGTTIIVSTNSHIYYDQNGNPLGIEGVLHDITDRKIAEEKLRESEERFRAIFECGAIGIAALRTGGEVLECNRVFQEMTGYTSEELKSIRFSEFTHPDDLALEEKLVGELKASKRRFYQIEKRYIRKDGMTIWVRLTAAALPDAECNVTGGVCLIEDITKRKRAEEMLKASLQEKEVLLKEVHHRVKNNLQIISSLLKLQSGFSQDERAREVLMDSQNRIRSMALVHEKIYSSEDLGRIEFGDYIQTLAAYLHRSYGIETRIKLRLELDKAFLGIDKVIPLGLIVTELIANCITHAFSGASEGEICIALRLNNGRLELVVRDNGIGLAEDFDINNTKSLGLTLVRNLVKQIIGTISLNGGSGTEVKIAFTA